MCLPQTERKAMETGSQMNSKYWWTKILGSLYVYEVVSPHGSTRVMIKMIHPSKERSAFAVNISNFLRDAKPCTEEDLPLLILGEI